MTYFRDQSLQSAVNSSSYTVSSTPSSPQPPKVFSKLILAVYSTWQGIPVETSSLSTTRHDCTDAWWIAIFIVLCKFWIIICTSLVYECFGKITIKLFIKGKFLLLYRMDSRDPELTVLSQTSDHLTIQSQSETVAWGDSWTSGKEPDLARSLLSLYCVRLYKCQIPTSKVSNYTPVQ